MSESPSAKALKDTVSPRTKQSREKEGAYTSALVFDTNKGDNFYLLYPAAFGERMDITRAIGAFFLDIIETVVIALSIFLVVYLFLLQPHQVNGQSMVPNFQDKEYLLTDKISYKLGKPQRGDVVVFHAPPAANCAIGTGCDFIKRVLGLPGDQVEVKDNGVWVNGVKLSEPYIPSSFDILPGAYTKGKIITLGPDEYFVCGDNRPYSSDSRAWGPITSNEIVGRAFFRYWPADKAGWISKPGYSLDSSR